MDQMSHPRSALVNLVNLEAHADRTSCGPQAKIRGPQGDLAGLPGNAGGPPRDLVGPQARSAGPRRHLGRPSAKITGPEGNLARPRRLKTGPQRFQVGPNPFAGRTRAFFDSTDPLKPRPHWL